MLKMGCFGVRGGAGIFWLGGPRPRGLGDGSPPVKSRGETPVGNLGDFVPQKLKHFLKIGINFYQKIIAK